MGDMGDTFNAMRESGKERRASNRETTPELLRRHGIPFDTKNDGAHLIVYHGGKIADLWPGTGKYQVRGTGKYRRGVFNMLRDLGVGIMVDKREKAR
jgi:hypothetical protein